MLSLSSLLLYFGLPFGTIGAIAAALVLLTPYGPALVAFFAGSKLARIAGGLALGALAIALACLKAFNAGKATARADQAKADGRAIATVHQADAAVDGMSDAEVDARLSKWVKE